MLLALSPTCANVSPLCCWPCRLLARMCRLFVAGLVAYLRECFASLLLALSPTCANVSPLCCWPCRLLARMFRLFVAGPVSYLRECFAFLLLALSPTCANVSRDPRAVSLYLIPVVTIMKRCRCGVAVRLVANLVIKVCEVKL